MISNLSRVIIIFLVKCIFGTSEPNTTPYELSSAPPSFSATIVSAAETERSVLVTPPSPTTSRPLYTTVSGAIGNTRPTIPPLDMTTGILNVDEGEPPIEIHTLPSNNNSQQNHPNDSTGGRNTDSELNRFNYTMINNSSEQNRNLTNSAADSGKQSESNQDLQRGENMQNLTDCGDMFCVRKCCPSPYVYEKSRTPCVLPKSGKAWIPEDPNFKLIYGLPTPEEGEDCLLHDDHEFLLQDNGKIYLKDKTNVFDHDSYCVDYLQEENEPLEFFAALCIRIPVKTTYDIVTDKLHFAGSIITCVSLFLLIVVQLFVIRQTGDFASKCLLSMVSAMFLAYTSLVINLSPAVKHITKEKGQCISLAIIQQFFFLSFYFWLNVKCFEIWRNVKCSILGFPKAMIRGTMRRYFVYSGYAWGIPFLVSTVTIIMQLLPAQLQKSLITPGIGEGRCWFAERKASLFLFYYGIQVILHVSNVVFMVHAGYMMFFKRQIIQQDGEFQIQNRDRCLKLFWQQFYVLSVIIVVWMLDSASTIHPFLRFWRVIDFLNSLQGLYLLILVLFRDAEIRKRMSNISSSAKNAVTTSGKSKKSSMSSTTTSTSSTELTSAVHISTKV